MSALRDVLGDDWLAIAGVADWRGVDGQLPAAWLAAKRAARTVDGRLALARHAGAWGRDEAVARRYLAAEAALGVSWELSGDAVCAMRLAEVRVALGRTRDACSPAEAAWCGFRDALGPKDPRTMQRLWMWCRLLLELGEGAAAVEPLRDVADSSELSSWWLGLALGQAGDWPEAVRRVEAGIVNAQGAERANRLGGRADLYARMGRHAEAMDSLREAFDADPEPAGRARWALVLARQLDVEGQLEEAMGWVEIALPTGPEAVSLRRVLLAKRRAIAEADGDMELVVALRAAERK